MTTDLDAHLRDAPVVPLVQADDPAIAVEVARALRDGGLPVIEVVLRSERALDGLRAVADELEGVVVGAGTVLSRTQATAALQAGARFIVSPGLDDGVIDVARTADVAVLPGIYTPGELQRAYNLGLDTVKFFPASIAGGVPALKALASVFRGIRFMPTGGVSAANLAEYLALPAVLACGGSWLTPADAVRAGDYARVTALAREAVAIAASARPSGV